MFKLRYLGFLLILLIVAAILYKIFFHHVNAPAQGMPAGAAMPATVASVVSKQVEIWNEFSGRLEATDRVEIRPQVGGTIQKVLFQEGSIVHKGETLFIIDQRPYEAQLQTAEANLAAAKSQVAFTSEEYKRAESLVGNNVISKSRYDEKQSAAQSAVSAVKSAEAALAIAKLNMEYSAIKAPITGRISRAEITEGNLVNPAMQNPLASIVSIDPIYAEFEIDEQTYLKYSGVSDVNSEVSTIPVQVVMAGDNTAVIPGHMKAFDNQLDAKSGTIRARAVVDNKDGKLLPGLFAKIRLGNVEKKDAILISEQAVGTDQDKKFVLVVGADNKVQYRPVVLGAMADGLRVVDSGLQAGEKIIVTGLFKFRPDMVVAPTEVAMEEKPKDPAAAPAQPKAAGDSTDANTDADQEKKK